MKAVNRIVDLSWIMRMRNIKEENSECFSFKFIFHFFLVPAWVSSCKYPTLERVTNYGSFNEFRYTQGLMFCSVQVLNKSSSWFCFFVTWSSLRKKKMEEVYVTVLIKNKAKQKFYFYVSNEKIKSKNFSIFSGSLRKL